MVSEGNPACARLKCMLFKSRRNEKPMVNVLVTFKNAPTLGLMSLLSAGPIFVRH